MRHSQITLAAVAMAVTAAILAGCDTRPAPPRNASGKVVTTLMVATEPASGQGSAQVADPRELTLAQNLTDAYANYQYRLTVIHAYYVKVGLIFKQRWAERELKNLDQAQTFHYAGLKPSSPAQTPNLDNADEATLAEQVVEARKAYLAALGALQAYYKQSNEDFKAQLVANARQRLDPIRTYRYFLDAEVPPADLKPSEVIPAAEELYAEAHKLYKDGKILPLVVDYNKERQALLKFQDLVYKYPTSTRIAYAAYYIADIYKEYFNENYRAVLWYQRAWQWDPNITKPARFQAAVVYDFRLHHRGEALKLYRQVLEHERFNESNLIFARRRIAQLTGGK